MPLQKLKEYLDKNKIKYITITHSVAFTAQEVAASAHIPGKELAKVVMIKLDEKIAMAVLPASQKVDFQLLKKELAKKIELATELEFKHIFPGCEVGAMPPFGNLYDIKVFVADTLANDEIIAFNAGNYTELIRMYYSDFEKLVNPTLIKFSKNYKY